MRARRPDSGQHQVDGLLDQLAVQRCMAEQLAEVQRRGQRIEHEHHVDVVPDLASGAR
jgi:hypothetical protein